MGLNLCLVGSCDLEVSQNAIAHYFSGSTFHDFHPHLVFSNYSAFHLASIMKAIILVHGI